MSEEEHESRVGWQFSDLGCASEIVTGSTPPKAREKLCGGSHSFIKLCELLHCLASKSEDRLSVVEELDGVVSANLQRATRLRPSILQKAFTGSLVVQPPNEPPTANHGICKDKKGKIMNPPSDQSGPQPPRDS